MKNINDYLVNFIVSFNKLSKPIKIIIIVLTICLLCIIVASISSSIQKSAKKQKYEDEIDSVLAYAKTSIQSKGYETGVNPEGYKIYEVGADNSKIYELKYTYYHQNVFGNNVKATSFCWVMTRNGKPISCYNGADKNYYNLNDWKTKNNWKAYTTPELDALQQKVDSLNANMNKTPVETQGQKNEVQNEVSNDIDSNNENNTYEQGSPIFGGGTKATDTYENSIIENNNVPVGKTYIGISGTDISQELSRVNNVPIGVYVENIEPSSPADKAGLKHGDIITKLDNNTITSINELNSLKNNYEVGDTVSLTVYRDDSYMTIYVTLTENTNH